MLTLIMLALMCFYGIVPALFDFGAWLLIPIGIDLAIGVFVLSRWDMGKEYKPTIKVRLTYMLIFALSWGVCLKILLTPAPKPLYLTAKR